MPVEGINGILNVESAALHAPQVGVANTNPQHILSVGSNLYVSGDSPDVLTVDGNVVCEGVKVGLIEITPSYDLAAVSNVGNTTSNTLQFSNATTGFVTTANVEIGGNITLTSNAQVKVGSNVLAEYTGPHGREPKEMPLKKFPEIVFEDGKFDRNDAGNTFIQAGYTITGSGTDAVSLEYPVRLAFNGKTIGTGDAWHSEDDYNSTTGAYSGPKTTTESSNTWTGDYIELKIPKLVKMSHLVMFVQPMTGTTNSWESRFPKEFVVLGSQNGTTWSLIKTVTDIPIAAQQNVGSYLQLDASAYYKYFRIVVSKNRGNTYTSIGELEYYGYEEPAPPGDLSLDTTLKSTFNSVRSNNYVMYFDGEDPAAGNVPKYLPSGSVKSITPNNVVFDATNNCWTLDGSTESNVTTGSLGLVGDAPHTVSTWINASNLEANATTQQLFSIGSGYSEEIVRVDDTQIAANTWHNVTYAYQGEGGSKVTYVDGRKVEEAQLEDTFGDYPPFAMTDYETGGYRVSASSEYPNSEYLAWEAFDDDITDNSHAWISGNLLYNQTTGSYNGNVNLGAGVADNGEWIKIEMPHKLVLDYITICGDDNSGVNPKDWKIYGSNDDKNWDVLLSKTNVLVVGRTATSGKEHTVNATKAYKYFALVVTKSGGYNGGNHYIQVSELEFYGHKEGDLTRFPEPTRVLKYPHIAMTGYAQRGYVATASNETLADGNRVWHVFDENDSTFWKCDERYTSAGVENTSSGLTDTSSTAHGGEYVVLESPNKLNITGFNLTRDGTNSDTIGRSPGSIAFLGKNSAPTVTTGWTLIAQQTTSTYTNNVAPLTISGNSNYFKYHAVVIRSIDGNQLRFHIKNIELLGTQEDTGTPAIVGGPFAGKVANFRVYDQYLGDERIQEIYDAQKDAFGHKKSSMTFYKGRVGVGTTEPEGALTVVDERHALAKFPVRAVSADDSYVEGDGQIKLSAADGTGYKAFDGLTSTSWDSTPTRNTRLSEEVDFGAWLKIQTPESMSLKKAEFESKPDWMQVGGDINGSAVDDHFGRAVACSHDGTRVIVGGHVHSGSQGMVRVYDWNGSGWTMVGNVLTGTADLDKFGSYVAISGDGNIIAVAAPFEHVGSDVDKGTVRVYYLYGATWTILPDSGSLTADVTSGVPDVFVGSAANMFLGNGPPKLSYDGKTIAMCEYGYDATGPTLNDAGRVLVYKYSNGAWSYKGTGATQFVGDTADAHFGFGMSMSEDGDHLALGTRDAGHFVEVYKWDGSSWNIKGSRLSESGLTGNDDYGPAISISNDGNTLAVGARNADLADGARVDNGGLVFVYHWTGTAWGTPHKLQYNEAADEDFGISVELSGDGKRLIVGASAENSSSGELFTFEYTGTSWIMRTANVSGAGGGTSGLLGYGPDGDAHAVAISRDGSTIVGGELGYNSGVGRVRVFSMPSNIKSIWGSNDDVNWTKITTAPTREEATSNVAGLAFGYDDRLEFKNLDNPNYYKYHAIVADAFTRLKDIKLFGIRNQGSSTLHDGALTLTKKVTAPQLESTGIINMKGDYTEIRANSNVVTEFPRSKKLIKYPRVALTSAAGESSGYQGYKVTSSFSHSGFNDWEAFDNGGDNVGWHTADGASREYNNGGEGTYSGTLQTRLASNTELGEWLQIKLPHAIRLERYVIIPQGTLGANAGNSPGSAVVYGSNDGTTWKEVHRYTDHIQDSGGCKRYTFQTSTIEMYNRFAIVVTKRGTSGGSGYGVSIQEWELYGIPEYDPEAHGTDVVVKSVPNVPNTDWLEVYYDAKDLADGVVTSVDDLTLSGTNDGTATNVTVSDGAFVFNGTSDIRSTVSTFTGDQPHTMSVWVNISTSHTLSDGYICVLAPSTGENLNQVSTIRYQNDGFNLQSWGNDIQMYNIGVEKGRWYHLVAVYDGGGVTTSSKRLYIDTVQNTRISGDSTTGDEIDFANTTLSLGSRVDGTSSHLTGSIANFRLFNRALTTDEIWQLYAYQKEYFGHGDLGMTLKAGRLGIGTSEPRAALDVRGDILGGCPAAFSVAYNPTSLSGEQIIIWNLIYHNVGGGYDSSDGLFTAPVSGYYSFTVWGMTSGNTSGVIELRFQKNRSTVQQRPYSQGVNNYGHVSGTIIEYLSVGDTMNVKLTSGTTMYASSSQSYNGFSGFYLSS